MLSSIYYALFPQNPIMKDEIKENTQNINDKIKMLNDSVNEGYIETTLYIWDLIGPENSSQEYFNSCAYPIKFNSNYKFMTIDTKNDIRDNRGIINVLTPDGEVSITIKDQQVKIVTDSVNKKQEVYVNGKYNFGHWEKKEEQTTDLNEYRKIFLNPKLITFEFESSNTGTMQDVIRRGKLVLYDIKKVYYYEEIMKEFFKNATPKQQDLFDLLEKNKNAETNVKISSYPTSLVRLINYLQGQVTKITDDHEYVKFLFQAVKYDCLKFIDIDKKRLHNFLICVDDYDIKIIIESYNIIIKSQFLKEINESSTENLIIMFNILFDLEM
jgi:hypothetical protein